jgi:pimeloyl-ACP methyl ester carboxylesterase
MLAPATRAAGGGTVPTADVNGARLNYVAEGADGPPLVLVHGSWGSHAEWRLVLPLLSDRFRVVAYDRRGHGASTCPPGQGSVHEDAADLAALIEALGLGPAWVAGNSFGGSIALRATALRPDLVRGVTVHEPPLFALLAGDPEFAAALEAVGIRIRAVVETIAAGDHAAAAETFVETVALGPGSWAQMPPELRAAMVAAAPTFLDEARDPEQLKLDPAPLAAFAGPILLTEGSASPPIFPAVIARLAAALPRAAVARFDGAGHVPHASHPEGYATMLARFAGQAA